MRVTRAWMGLSAIAASLVIMAGCVQPPEVASVPAERTGKVTLFERPDGLGQIALQVIDRREGRSTQALGLADDWDEVRLRLSSSKLRAARSASIAFGNPGFTAARQSTYATDALGQLPPASDYQLMVTIASQSIVLGQGASESISVLPGSVATVSIYVNTVGTISFYNADYITGIGTSLLASASLGYPELLADSAVEVSPNFPNTPADVPASQRFDKYYTELRSLSGTLLLATSSVSATSPQQILTLPALPAGTNEAIQRVTVVGLNASDEVIATKTRNILVLRGAGLGVDLNPLPSPSAAAYVAPAARPARVRTGPAILSVGSEHP